MIDTEKRCAKCNRVLISQVSREGGICALCENPDRYTPKIMGACWGYVDGVRGGG
jgi:hypothetical protein